MRSRGSRSMPAKPLLSPAAVATLHGCGVRTVQTAIANGEIRATPILGPSGDPVTYGVREDVARRWSPRRRGRPRLDSDDEG